LGVESGVFTARRAALKALEAFRRNKAWPDLVLGGLIDRYGLQARDAALASRIVNGVIQNMSLCDYYITCFSSISINKIEPRVLDVLRMSIYQLVFLDKIPPSAAVNESVVLVRSISNPRAAGFVNAVLRNVAQSVKTGSLPEIAGDPGFRLSIKYSHPEWLVSEICENLGIDSAEAFLLANNAANLPTTVQVNTLRSDADNVLRLLDSNDTVPVRHEWLDDCVELSGARGITRLEAFRRGFIYVQDAAARLAVAAAAPKPGDFVIDGCAAPGGKSFAAAIMMRNSGRILALDINEKKLQGVSAGAKRLGIGIIETLASDASICNDELKDKADVVIADVPCSGFGVIRKKPEIRYKTQQEISSLPGLQRMLLSALSRYVRPGGTLLYSTCTVLRRENEEVVEPFIRENPQFSTEGFKLPGAGLAGNGMITLWPHIHGTDGFFICRLRRNG